MMNEEQKKRVREAIESHRRALETLDVLKDATAIESHRRTLQILEDEEAMEGIYESLEAIQRGERGTPLKDLKRKQMRA
jgi:hypothetical protein